MFTVRRTAISDTARQVWVTELSCSCTCAKRCSINLCAKRKINTWKFIAISGKEWNTPTHWFWLTFQGAQNRATFLNLKVAIHRKSTQRASDTVVQSSKESFELKNCYSSQQCWWVSEIDSFHRLSEFCYKTVHSHTYTWSLLPIKTHPYSHLNTCTADGKGNCLLLPI